MSTVWSRSCWFCLWPKYSLFISCSVFQCATKYALVWNRSIETTFCIDNFFWHLIFRHFDWISFICFWIHLIGLLIWPIRWFYVTTNWRNQSKQVSSTTASRSTKGLGHRCTQINLNVHYTRLHLIGRSLTSRISNGFCHFTVENSRNPAIGPLFDLNKPILAHF